MSKYHKLLLLIIALIIGAACVVKYKPVRKGLDIAGGIRVVLQAEKGHEKEITGKMNAVIETIRNRVEGLSGVAEPIVRSQGTDRIVVELPGVEDKETALEMIQSTASLEFYWIRDMETDKNPAGKWKMLNDQKSDESGMDIISFQNKLTGEIIKGDTKEGQKQILIQVANAYDKDLNPNGQKPLLTGDDIKANARSSYSPDNRKPAINVSFNNHGTAVFRDFTRKHVGDVVAIFFGGRILTAPVINEAIPSGECVITGFSSLKEAQARANLLNAGALPVPLKIAAMDDIEATLGKETVDKAIFAGIIGLILVAGFMLLYYRLPGLLANVALAIYALLTYAAFKLLGVTMTLPGLAAFILSVGMAVDANILIFERLKEELKSGKTLRAAIDAGFGRAFDAIFDSNACSIITALVLIWYGTGSVKSFAFTLALGVAISMFTAITVTRTLLHLLVSLPSLQKPWLFGLGVSLFSNLKLNIVGKRNWYFALSALIIIPGLVFLTLNWLNTGSPLIKGIEFKSGTSIQMTFQRTKLDMNFADSVEEGTLKNALNSLGINNTIKMNGDKSAEVTVALGTKDRAEIDKLINTQLPDKGIKTTGEIKKSIEGPLNSITVSEIENIAKQLNIESESQMSGKDTVFINTSLQPDQAQKIDEFKNALQQKYGIAKISSIAIGPAISKELTSNAIWAVVIASIFIIIFLSVRYSIGGFSNGIKYGICAIGATLHDVLLILGIFAALGYFMDWQVDTLFVTAVLTIIGFSTHDTIVVFDRIRENLRHRVRGESYDELTNKSILQTFTRSINTSFGVVMMLITLIAFGGPVIQHFYIAFLIGIISGTYSSIFNASPLLVVWDKIATRSKTSATSKPSEGKVLATPKVKEMKPMVEVTTADDKNETPSAVDKSDKTKVKPKKKKRY